MEISSMVGAYGRRFLAEYPCAQSLFQGSYGRGQKSGSRLPLFLFKRTAINSSSQPDMRGDVQRLTRILGILWTNVFIAGIQNIFIHQGSSWRNLPEEAHFNGLSNLDPLPLLNKYLPGILATIFPIQTWYTILFRMMTFLEGLQCCHEVVASRNSGSYHPLGDAGCDGALDNGGD